MIAGVALIALAAMGSAAADDIVQPKGMMREAVWVPFRESGSLALRLEARLIHPTTSGRYPLVLISHGSPRNKADAKTKTIDWADWIAARSTLMLAFTMLIYPAITMLCWLPRPQTLPRGSFPKLQ